MQLINNVLKFEVIIENTVVTKSANNPLIKTKNKFFLCKSVCIAKSLDDEY